MNEVYYRILMVGDQQEPFPVAMRRHDEYEYDQTLFANDVRYPNKELAEYDIKRYNRRPDVLKYDHENYLQRVSQTEAHERYIDEEEFRFDWDR